MRKTTKYCFNSSFNSNSKLGCKIFLFLGNDDCISNIAKSYSSLEEYAISFAKNDILSSVIA